MTSSNRSLRATCTKKAAPTWFAEAIWTLLLFWPTVAHRGRLDDVIDERSFSDLTFENDILLIFSNGLHFRIFLTLFW